MNRKGFTLVELLAVIAILGVLAIITVPIVSNVIQSGKVKAYEAQVGIVVDASKKWGEKNVDYLTEDRPIYLSVNKLVSSGMIEQDKVINPVTSEEMTGCVKIDYSTTYQQYNYEYIGDCSSYLKVYTNGTSVNFNPETGQLCNNPSMAAGSKTGCLTWYIFNDSVDELKVNMILANNTTQLVAYALQNDYVGAGGDVSSFSSSGNDKGGLTVKAKLADDTKTWIKEYNPRLLNTNDVRKIIGSKYVINAYGNCYLDGGVSSKTSSNPSLYGWLFGNLYDTTTYGGINPINTSYPSRFYDASTDTNVEMWNYQLGYWLEDGYDGNQAVAINNTGLITHSEVQIYNYYGVRPVISIPKNILD